ncbi:MAG: hypothetical protein GY763_05880 [Gammaproteobacteria bacterium]|nr:hypothetical protein [Gammaproteobacteria bacterium]
MGNSDVNICVGVSVANRLSDMNTPVVEITFQLISALLQVSRIKISVDGVPEVFGHQ